MERQEKPATVLDVLDRSCDSAVDAIIDCDEYSADLGIFQGAGNGMTMD